MSSEPILSYKAIEGESTGLYTEKRSKFVSIALPVTDEEEAKLRIDELRQKYYDARHVCWAYVVGKKVHIERSNDDGEPSSTAGKPILGQIISRGLTNTLVVVVRYFGGGKLGTGGLIVAYRTAAHEALEAATIVEHQLTTQYALHFGFDYINPVMLLLRNHSAATLHSDSDLEGYHWRVELLDRHIPAFESEATQLYQLQWERLSP